MDKQSVVLSRRVKSGSPVVIRKSGRGTNVSPRANPSLLTVSYCASPTITYDFLNRKYGELDSCQGN